MPGWAVTEPLLATSAPRDGPFAGTGREANGSMTAGAPLVTAGETSAVKAPPSEVRKPPCTQVPLSAWAMSSVTRDVGRVARARVDGDAGHDGRAVAVGADPRPAVHVQGLGGNRLEDAELVAAGGGRRGPVQLRVTEPVARVMLHVGFR